MDMLKNRRASEKRGSKPNLLSSLIKKQDSSSDATSGPLNKPTRVRTASPNSAAINSNAAKEAIALVKDWKAKGGETAVLCSEIAKIIGTKLRMEESVKILKTQVVQLKGEVEMYQNMGVATAPSTTPNGYSSTAFEPKIIVSPPNELDNPDGEQGLNENEKEEEPEQKSFESVSCQTEIDIRDAFSQTAVKTFQETSQQCSNLTVVMETACQTEQLVRICEEGEDSSTQTDDNLTKKPTCTSYQQTTESGMSPKIDQFCQFPELVADIVPVGIQWECARPLVQACILPALAIVRRESSALKKLVNVNKHALKTTSVTIDYKQRPPHSRNSTRYLQGHMYGEEEARLKASILNQYLENYLETRRSEDKDRYKNNIQLAHNVDKNKELTQTLENKQRQLEALGNLHKLYSQPLKLTSDQSRCRTSSGLVPSRPPRGTRTCRSVRRQHQRLVINTDSETNANTNNSHLPQIGTKRSASSRLLPSTVFKQPPKVNDEPGTESNSDFMEMECGRRSRSQISRSSNRLRDRAASNQSILTWHVPMPGCKCETCSLLLPNIRTMKEMENLKLNGLSIKIGSKVFVRTRTLSSYQREDFVEVTGTVRYIGHVTRFCPSQPNGVFVGVELEHHAYYSDVFQLSDGVYMGRRYFTTKNSEDSSLFVPVQDVFVKASKSVCSLVRHQRSKSTFSKTK